MTTSQRSFNTPRRNKVCVEEGGEVRGVPLSVAQASKGKGCKLDAYQLETTPASHNVPGSIVPKVNLLASIRVSAQGTHCQDPPPSMGGLSSTPWEKKSPRG